MKTNNTQHEYGLIDTSTLAVVVPTAHNSVYIPCLIGYHFQVDYNVANGRTRGKTKKGFHHYAAQLYWNNVMRGAFYIRLFRFSMPTSIQTSVAHWMPSIAARVDLPHLLLLIILRSLRELISEHVSKNNHRPSVACRYTTPALVFGWIYIYIYAVNIVDMAAEWMNEWHNTQQKLIKIWKKKTYQYGK